MEKLWIVLLALLVINANFLIVSAKSCERDSDCGAGDCCIEYAPYVKLCKDRGDDEGDLCGGQFHCGCAQGLTCRTHNPSIWNAVKLGAGNCVSESSRLRYETPEVEFVNL